MTGFAKKERPYLGKGKLGGKMRRNDGSGTVLQTFFTNMPFESSFHHTELKTKGHFSPEKFDPALPIFTYLKKEKKKVQGRKKIPPPLPFASNLP